MNKRSRSIVGAAALTLALTGQSLATVAQDEAHAGVDGVFDVGGHGLYMDCQGTGSPTVVYLHGAVWDTAEVPTPHANGRFAQQALAADHRVCVYDRRNVGLSDVVDAPQLPDDAITDLHELLAAAEVEPPYVLLGASFGGLLADLYAKRYPDEVVGMVLLDSMFPDYLALQEFLPPEEREVAKVEADERDSPERMAHYKALSAAQSFIGREPAIPVTYLGIIPEGYSEDDFGIPEYLELQRGYVDRWGPGTYIRVDSPHFMEAAIPDRIVEELRSIIAQAGY